jgi:isoaspartyl peptidase/L-asparaginase-like protein (Ntn-hydrolase superfamily)
MKSRIALAIHGGAGVIARSDSSRQEAVLRVALAAGYSILEKHGTAMDAVCAAVVVLEDSPLFNAGRGAAYNADERHELDASVMDGASLRAGAVAAVTKIRNPVLAARAVMEKTPHVMLAGPQADRFAKKAGLKLVAPSYFHTEGRLAALRRRARKHHGTVGAVALDRNGNLAAATSTGGYTGKMPGRVGDSPIIGAGTWADNDACAVSGTGDGELFMRTCLAFHVATRMKYKGEALARAAAHALSNIKRLGGDGGLIAIDRKGNIAMPYNSAGMYRGAVSFEGRIIVRTFR